MARRTATSYRRTTVTKGTDEPQETEGGPAEGSRAAEGAEDKGLGLAEALSIATAFVLLAAILMLDAYLGKRYGKGFLFG